MIEKHSSPVYPPLSALPCENDYRSTSCGKLLPGGIEQPALYGYDRIAFSCFHIVKLLELASQAALHQTTGVFVTGRLLTGRLQVRILFEEPPKGHLPEQVALQCVYMEYQLSEEIELVEDSTIDYQHFFQALLEAVPWPLLIIDRSLFVHYYNHDAVQLLEVQVPLQHLKLDQLISDRAILELVQSSIQADSPVEEECTREGTGTSWKVSVKPLTHRPHKTRISQQNITTSQTYHYFAIAIEDLTELRRLERVRRDFIANISHELRTPLASVRLLVETLEDAIDTDPDQAQTFIEKIETEVQNLTELVSEILELSRIESGQVPMRIEPIEAEQLVREVMARMLTLAQRHRVQLRTEIEQGKSLVVADSKQILRVLVNLVHNAIKYTPSGGIVVVGTRLEEGGNTQSFFVRDTGIGIPTEDLPRIFERFYKVNQARSKADFIGGPGGGGSGLGLAIARHVVEAHGGRIKVESVVGQGSVFTFALPVAIHVF